MRILVLSAALGSLLTGIASAEISDGRSGASVISGVEYVPDEGGTFTQVTATGLIEDETPARFVDLGPLPEQPGQAYLQAMSTTDPTTDNAVLDATGEIGTDFRRALLYELPTFLRAEPVVPLALATDGDDVTPMSTPSLPTVPLPATGFLLLAAGGGLALLRRQR